MNSEHKKGSIALSSKLPVAHSLTRVKSENGVVLHAKVLPVFSLQIYISTINVHCTLYSKEKFCSVKCELNHTV